VAKIIDLQLQSTSLCVWTDLHLAAERPGEIAAFAAQVEAVPTHVALLCLGDLFDAWTGAETTAAGDFEAVTAALHARASSGGRSILLRGNRDVLLNSASAQGLGWELADRVIWQSPDLQTVLFSHGDEYCVNDQPYQRLRRLLRSSWVRGLLKILPGATRSWIAKRMRGHSQVAVARKALDSLALSPEAAIEPLLAVGASLGVIGHLHKAAEHDLAGNRHLTVLPAWEPGQPAWTGSETSRGA